MTELCGAGAKWLKAASERPICFCYPLILPVSTAIARFRPLFARFHPLFARFRSLFDPSFLCPQSPPFPPLFLPRFLPRLSPALPSVKASSWYPHPLFSRCYWICLINCVFCRSKPMPSSKVPLPQLKHAQLLSNRNATLFCAIFTLQLQRTERWCARLPGDASWTTPPSSASSPLFFPAFFVPLSMRRLFRVTRCSLCRMLRVNA